MRGRSPEIEALGGRLVFVGSGTPQQAAHFQRSFAPACTVLTDPGLDAYRALGLRRGVWATLGPSTWGGAVRALARGHLQSRVQGDPWQQGGLFVMLPGGRIVFEQRNRDAADRPDIEGALAALRRQREAGAGDPSSS